MCVSKRCCFSENGLSTGSPSSTINLASAFLSARSSSLLTRHSFFSSMTSFASAFRNRLSSEGSNCNPDFFFVSVRAFVGDCDISLYLVNRIFAASLFGQQHLGDGLLL